jgi:hypothetical protein
MGTSLSTTARHLAVALTLAVGAAGAVALPAWAASQGKSPAHHRTGHPSVGTKVGNSKIVRGGVDSTKAAHGGVHLGPAVKYKRHKDGSIHRTR